MIFAKYFKHEHFSPFGCYVDGASPSDAGGSSGAPASATPPASGGGSAESSGSSSSPATPSSEPAPSPDAGATPPPSAPSTNPWEALGSADLDTHQDEDAIAIPEQPPAEPPAQPQPVPPAPPPVAPPVPPAAAQPPQPAQESQPPAAAPLPSPGEPEALATAMLQPENMARIVEHLAPRFVLSEEDAAAFEQDAVQALPKLAARLHVEAVTASMKFLAQAFPQMLQRHEQVSKANNAAKEKFFKSFPALNAGDPKHEQLATRLVSLYKAQNPQATMDEVIAQVGPMVIFSLGLQGAAPPNGAPAAPPQPAPSAGAFRPAVGGGGGGPAVAVENPWAGMGQAYDE